jgi:Lrp/AsnC family transcriptional regulator for asnA, asnC and gidA
MARYNIDNLDQKILGFLIKNARMPFLEVARECGISGAAIHQRVKKLEEAGVITGSSLQVKPAALGLDVCAFVGVHLNESNYYENTIEALKVISEVVECHFVTGSYQLLLKVYCHDHEHLMDILVNTIQRIPNVQKTETLISLDQTFERQVWVKNKKTVKN